MILDNVRTPSMNENDLKAMIASAQHGIKRFTELLDKYGVEIVFSAIEDWMDYSERMLRSAIKKVPDGTYYAEGYLDNDGKNLDKMLKVCTTTTIKDDSITIDLTAVQMKFIQLLMHHLKALQKLQSIILCMHFSLMMIFMSSTFHKMMVWQDR